MYKETTYLSGAMDMVADGGVNWREKLMPRLEELGIVVLDPVLMSNKLLQVPTGRDAKWKLRMLAEEDKKEYRRIMEMIKKNDIDAVLQSDFIITRWDYYIPTYGTVAENWTAAMKEIPIYCVCPAPDYVLPHWFRDDIDISGGQKFNNDEELIKFLKQRKEIIEQFSCKEPGN